MDLLDQIVKVLFWSGTTVVLLFLGAVVAIGWRKVIGGMKNNVEAIKIGLATVAAVYTGFVFYVDMELDRVANTLAFQERTESGSLQKAFDTLNVFWIRGAGKVVLEEHRARHAAAKNDKERSAANKVWTMKTKTLVTDNKLEDEIFTVFDFYRDITVCVRQGRCHQPTACELFAEDVENFRLVYTKFLSHWQRLWGREIKPLLKTFRYDCVEAGYLRRGSAETGVSSRRRRPWINTPVVVATAQQSVKNSVGEYVDGMAHNNGIESLLWAMLKRGYRGTFHRISPEHAGSYVNEFSGRHNIRDEDPAVQMPAVVHGMSGKRLRYRDLIASASKPPALSDVF